MSLNDGLEYINTTKNRLKTRLQGKGVNFSEETPYGKYPDLIESELTNKSWQYPLEWTQLTSKAEFPNHTLEAILLGIEYDFCFYVNGSGDCSITLYSNTSGVYTLNDEEYNLNETYTISGGNLVFRLPVIETDPNSLYDTFKLVISYSGVLTNFNPKHTGNAKVVYSPVLAFRIKDTSSNAKRVFFGALNSNVKIRFLQYCDLSMLENLSIEPYTFSSCEELVKVELPQGSVLSNYCFNNCTNLKEVVGADFVNEYNRTYVFRGCNSFVPPSFNYVGDYSYYQVCLSSKIWWLPNVTQYPKNFIQNKTSSGFGDLDVTGNLFKINIPDTMNKFPHNAFYNMSTNCIIHLPSGNAEITTQPSSYAPDTMNAFIDKPFLVENGERFVLNEPVGVQLSGNNGFEQLYIPHIPLRWLIANCSASSKGNLKSIIFDGERSDFDSLSDTVTYAIRIDYQSFTRETLVELFNQLPIITKNRTVSIVGNPGTSELTDEDLSIAVNKNWTVAM